MVDFLFLILVLFGTLVLVWVQFWSKSENSPHSDSILEGPGLVADNFDLILRVIYAMPVERSCALAWNIIDQHGTKTSNEMLFDELKQEGFRNEHLLKCLDSYELVAFSNEDHVVSRKLVSPLVRDGATFLKFGGDVNGEIVYAIKQFDQSSIYELVNGSVIESVGTFCQFILLRYFYVMAEDITVEDALALICGNSEFN